MAQSEQADLEDELEPVELACSFIVCSGRRVKGGVTGSLRRALPGMFIVQSKRVTGGHYHDAQKPRR